MPRRCSSCLMRQSSSPVRCLQLTAAGASAKANTDMRYALGIDLGGTSIKAVSVTDGAKVLAKINRPFDLQVKLAWAENIRAAVSELQSEQPVPALCIGISAPGLASKD